MSFNLIAFAYDWLAKLVFGRTLEQAQEAAWQRMPLRTDVLVLGGGTGTFLPTFLAQKKPHRLVYIEASQNMLSKARKRVPEATVTDFRYGTEMSLTDHDRFDYILLPFVLDLYPDTYLREQFIPRLLKALAPKGALIITDFDQPRTTLQCLQMTTMIWFFRLVANVPVRRWTDWPTALRQAGLREIRHQTCRNGQVRSGWWRQRALKG